MPLPQDLVALEKALEAEFAAEKAAEESKAGTHLLASRRFTCINA